MHKSPKVIAKDARATERRYQALELKKAGLSYRQIARLGREKGWATKNYSEGAAHKDVQIELERLAEKCQESAKGVRELELARLDRLLAALNRGISEGDTQAINSAIRLSESRRKLLGVDAPDRAELEVSGGMTIVAPDKFETAEEWQKQAGK